MIDANKILILAPHTDDGELGCGGTIAKFSSQKRQVHYVAFSSCAKSLPKKMAADTLIRECGKATRTLGIPASRLSILNFDVREFPAQRQNILDEMIRINRSIQPDLVFIPCSSDVHQDHQVIHGEAMRAFKNTSLLGYELPWNHNRFHAQLYVTLTNSELSRKIRSLSFYASQSRRNYMKEDFIRSLAKVKGVQSGTAYAESFEVYKLLS